MRYPGVRQRIREPPQPTTAPPGSLEKIRVLTVRALLNQDLFHPDDAREIHHQEHFTLPSPDRPRTWKP